MLKIFSNFAPCPTSIDRQLLTPAFHPIIRFNQLFRSVKTSFLCYHFNAANIWTLNCKNCRNCLYGLTHCPNCLTHGPNCLFCIHLLKCLPQWKFFLQIDWKQNFRIFDKHWEFWLYKAQNSEIWSRFWNLTVTNRWASVNIKI